MKRAKVKKNSFWLYGVLIGIFLLFLLNSLWLVRHISEKQIDDVNFFIDCKNDSYYLSKSDVLMVIPIYKNQSIADFVSWCKEIKSLNKTLGMHGVYHSYNEFAEVRDEAYVLNGLTEFKKCFGYYPKYFEAPQIAMNSKNIAVIEALNMTYVGYTYNVFHEVYHCSDTGVTANSILNVF